MIFCYESQFNMHNIQILLVDGKSSTKQENKLSIYSFSSQYVEDVSWITKKHMTLHKIQNIVHSPVRHNSENIHICDAECNGDLTFLYITCRL